MFRSLKKPWMTAAEYRANLQGLNVFFGAVLGVVMAGTEGLNSYDYGAVLFLVATIVVTILYISSSKWRLIYTALTLVAVLLLPRIVDRLIDGTMTSLMYLQVTLFVWTVMAAVIEFTPREPGEAVQSRPAD